MPAAAGRSGGGGLTGLALLALYNIAFIAPLLILLLAVSNKRVLGQMGRWNRANSPWVIKRGARSFLFISSMFSWMRLTYPILLIFLFK
jgi:hypothetical protein